MTEEEFYRLKEHYNDFMMKVWSKFDLYCGIVEGIPSSYADHISDITDTEIYFSGTDRHGEYVGISMPIDIMWDTENVIAREKARREQEEEAERARWRWP
jgi:hypothetical protein